MDVTFTQCPAGDFIDGRRILALALRERRRQTHTWRGFLEELVAIPAKSRLNCSRLENTACLLSGMVPDKWDLLASLLPQDSMHPSIDLDLPHDLSERRSGNPDEGLPTI